MSFAIRLESCRKINPDTKEKESIRAFAARCGEPVTTVAAWLKGAIPDLERIWLLSKRLNVSPYWLAFGKKPIDRSKFLAAIDAANKGGSCVSA